MYAMVDIRLDLAFAISMISWFMSKLDPMHWMEVKRIMQYLKNTLDMRLSIGSKHINLKIYSNTDWAGDVNNCRSTSRYVLFVRVFLLLWNNKQQTIAQSTMKAEYMATSWCTKEAIWFKQLMKDVGCVQKVPTTGMCDNQGFMALAKIPSNHGKSKHIDV